MVCLNGGSISKCHLLIQLALVMILLICQSCSGGVDPDASDSDSIRCYFCDSSGSNPSCKIVGPDVLIPKCEKDAYCLIHAYNSSVQRGCTSDKFRQLNAVHGLYQGGKLCKCYFNNCNGFNVTKESDLDQCIKDMNKVKEVNNKSSVGGLHYSNVIELLISLCGFTLWFVSYQHQQH